MRMLIISSFCLTLAISYGTAQELSTVLEAHYEAAAQGKMDKVETIITRGKNTYSMAGFESTFKIFQARPNKLRVEGDYQGSKVIQTFNGSIGWKYAPTMKVTEPIEITGLELETLIGQVQFENPLWNYLDKGASLEMADQEDEPEYHLLLTKANGDKQHFFIDRESYLITKVTTSQLMGGSETDIEVLMSEYESVKGIPFAHHVVTKMNGQVVNTLHIEKVEINRKIAQHLFEKPEIE